MPLVRSRDGTRIAYERMGQGPAVVLVDGALCSRVLGPSGPLAARLTEHFTLFRYDRRGRGESGDTPPYSVDREIEDLDVLIGEAGGSAFVYGHSSGAVLALRAAARLGGGKVKRLALYEPPLAPTPAAQEAALGYSKRVSGLLAQNRRGDAVELFLTTIGLPAQMIVGMRRSPVWPAMEALAPSLAYDSAILGNGSVPVEAARTVGVPTLVLDGGRSPATMREAAQALAREVQRAKRLTLEGQTHDVKPETLAPVLAEFFQGI